MPGAPDAETTKITHVDFTDPNLPWQYSPVKSADSVRPWLALLVGTSVGDHCRGPARRRDRRRRGPRRSRSRPNRICGPTCRTTETVRSPGCCARGSSPVWHRRTSWRRRPITSPCWSQPSTATATRPGSIGDNRPRTLSLLHFWTFRTTESGDFESLAKAIRPRSADGLGSAPLRYHRGEVTRRPACPRCDHQPRAPMSTPPMICAPGPICRPSGTTCAPCPAPTRWAARSSDCPTTVRPGSPIRPPPTGPASSTRTPDTAAVPVSAYGWARKPRTIWSPPQWINSARSRWLRI